MLFISMTKTQLEKYIESGKSFQQISRETQVPLSNITRWAKKFGLKSKFTAFIVGHTSTHQVSQHIREKYDWKAIQADHDSGLSWKMLSKKYNVCSGTIDKARRDGFITLRTGSSAVKLAWKLGRIKAEIYQTDDFRKKQIKCGGLRKNAGHCKCITYTSPIAGEMSLNGTWEHTYAIWLDATGQRWRRNTDHFSYEYNGKVRKYFPDFYLVDEDVYVEIKGYETERDRAKWKQFPHRLKVLKREELRVAPYNFILQR